MSALVVHVLDAAPVPALRRRTGFTLIEMMLVVGIMGMVLAFGLPAMVRVLDREPLHQAVNDVVEALRQARELAILQGRPSEFVFTGDYQMVVRPLSPEVRNRLPTGLEAGWSIPEYDAEASLSATFTATLDDTIAVTALSLNGGPNLTQVADAREVRVRFFPNGTSDEFELEFQDASGARRIILDPVTGLPEVVTVR